MNYTEVSTAHYENLKIFIEAYTDLDRDALHIHIALLLYFLAMFAFRQSRRSRFPWMLILLFEIANELMDFNRERLSGAPLDWHEAAKDLWNTMLWPTVILLVGRYTSLFEHRRHHRKTRDEGDIAPPDVQAP